MSVRSGKLKTKVVVELKSKKKDSYGARLDEYNKVYAAKGDVRYLSGSDLIKNGVATNIEVITVLMRKDSRMAYNCFLSTKGERFEVVNIKPSDDSRSMIITATREV